MKGKKKQVDFQKDNQTEESELIKTKTSEFQKGSKWCRDNAISTFNEVNNKL